MQSGNENGTLNLWTFEPVNAYLTFILFINWIKYLKKDIAKNMGKIIEINPHFPKITISFPTNSIDTQNNIPITVIPKALPAMMAKALNLSEQYRSRISNFIWRWFLSAREDPSRANQSTNEGDISRIFWNETWNRFREMTLKVIIRISADKNATTRDFSNTARNSSNFLINCMFRPRNLVLKWVNILDTVYIYQRQIEGLGDSGIEGLKEKINKLKWIEFFNSWIL